MSRRNKRTRRVGVGISYVSYTGCRADEGGLRTSEGRAGTRQNQPVLGVGGRDGISTNSMTVKGPGRLYPPGIQGVTHNTGPNPHSFRVSENDPSVGDREDPTQLPWTSEHASPSLPEQPLRIPKGVDTGPPSSNTTELHRTRNKHGGSSGEVFTTGQCGGLPESPGRSHPHRPMGNFSTGLFWDFEVPPGNSIHLGSDSQEVRPRSRVLSGHRHSLLSFSPRTPPPYYPQHSLHQRRPSDRGSRSGSRSLP